MAIRIVLPANARYRFENKLFPKLDPVIVHTKNSLGFRGPELPADAASTLKIVAIGGSTTESLYLSDGQTWPDQLASVLERNFDRLWVNNAGLDGMSTIGHLVLLEDHIVRLRPQVALFLAGANDQALAGAREYDQERIRGPLDLRSWRALLKSAAPYSELAALGLNLYRSWRARTAGLAHRPIDLRSVTMVRTPPAARERLLEHHRREYLANYRQRLFALIKTSRRNGSEPVLITQPALFGAATDAETGADLRRVAYGDTDGETAWAVLELYNTVARELGREAGVLLIDLAGRLPKNSRLFYDYYHFTNEGARAVAEITYEELCPFLASRHPPHLMISCAPGW